MQKIYFFYSIFLVAFFSLHAEEQSVVQTKQDLVEQSHDLIWNEFPAFAKKHWRQAENNLETQTVYFQGLFGSEAAGCRYAGEYGVILPTNEYAVHKCGGEIILNVFTGPVIEEVRPIQQKGWKKWNPLYVAQELIADIAHKYYIGGIQVYETKNVSEGIRNRFTFIDLVLEGQSLKRHATYITRISLGQGGDIKNHVRKMKALRDQTPVEDEQKENINVILFGDSRGSAATFIAYATNWNNDKTVDSLLGDDDQTIIEDLYKDVKLVITEAIFEDVEEALAHHGPLRFRPFGFNILKPAQWLTHSFTWLLSSYVPWGESPVGVADLFPKTTPIVLVTSDGDTLVPAHSTKALAQKLVDLGHPHVYLINLKEVDHVQYAFGNTKDRWYYQVAIHAIYKKHGLPYIPEYAELGDQIMDVLWVSQHV